MQDCLTHPGEELSPEQRMPVAAAHVLRVHAAVRVASERWKGEPGYVGVALAEATVQDGIPGLPLDLTAILLPTPSGKGTWLLAYLWNFLEANPEPKVADDLVAHLRREAAKALGSK